MSEENTSPQAITTPRSRPPALGIIPTNSDEAWSISKYLEASRLMPKGMERAEQVFAVILAGAEMGLPPMASIRSLYIVEGTVTMSAALMQAKCIESPACRFFRVTETTTELCTAETLRSDWAEPQSYTYTIEDAKRAGKVGTGKKNWDRFPQNMLRARAISNLARMVYPEVLVGVYTRDEAEEIVERNVTASGRVVSEEDDAYYQKELRDAYAAIESAEDVDALMEVAMDIKGKRFPPVDKDSLARAYSARRESLLDAAELPEPEPVETGTESTGDLFEGAEKGARGEEGGEG